MKECVQHELLQPYPVLWEKEGDHIAHVKFTVLVMPNGRLFLVVDKPLQDVFGGKCFVVVQRLTLVTMDLVLLFVCLQVPNALQPQW